MTSRKSSSAVSSGVLQLRAALAEALKDREAAWNAQAKLVEKITGLNAEVARLTEVCERNLRPSLWKVKKERAAHTASTSARRPGTRGER